MEKLSSISKKKLYLSFYCVSHLWFSSVEIQSPQFVEISNEKKSPIDNPLLSIKQGKFLFKLNRLKIGTALARTDLEGPPIS